MKPKRFGSHHRISPSPVGYWPTKETFSQAWGLFVFSSIFAVLFNAVYVYGIDLKFQPPKGPSWHPSAPVSYTGFGTTTPNPSASPTPLPGDLDSFPRLNLEGTKQRFDKKSAVFLDARKPEEYKEGHIPGALNLYGNEPEKFAPIVMPQLPDKNKEIIVYCHGGDCDLSLLVAKTMREAGYTHVEIFQEGWPAWTQAGYAINPGETP
jgi:rhodanese-related sulfurtransferase